MFFGNRDEIRQFYFRVYAKLQSGAILDPLEAQIASVIADHPEYHPLLGAADEALQRQFTPEQRQSNPFLHMGMHLTLREQVSTNRPAGIRAVFTRLAKKHGTFEAEHRMMECLGVALWAAQQQQRAPDESTYLECLLRL